MICPACQTAHADPPPRFCDGCGLALPRLRPAAPARARGAETPEVRCPECGTPATARRCRACGARVRWPEDLVPPDDEEGAPGKPPAPALELANDEAGELGVDEDVGAGVPPEER